MTRETGAFARILLLSALLSSAISVSPAQAASVALGVFGLYGFPLQRADLSPGPFGGAKVRVGLRAPFAAEFGIASFREGDRQFRLHGRTETLQGGTETFFLGHAVAGVPGPGDTGLYVALGGGAYRLERQGRDRGEGPAYSAGLGVERRSNGTLAVDASVRWMLLPLDEGGGRETLAFQMGVNYYLTP